jgi:hypothetical protein
LDGVGCNLNRKACPVALVMVPSPETAKWISFLLIFDSYNIKIFSKQQKDMDKITFHVYSPEKMA